MAHLLGLLAAVVRVVTTVIGAVVLLHAALVYFEANPGSPLVEFATAWRDTFAWFTSDLFRFGDPAVTEAVNDVVAALVYLVAGSIASSALVSLAPRPRVRL